MNFQHNQHSLYSKHPPYNQPTFLTTNNRFSQQYYEVGLHPFSIHQSFITAARREGKGKWSAYQQSLYIQFLSENIVEMSNTLNRKTYKVFLKMSKIIRTRTADQCRSHHQKILKYHSSVEDIIIRYQRRLRGEDINRKKQQRTGDDLQNVQGFYTLNRIGNAFKIAIEQSAVHIFIL